MLLSFRRIAIGLALAASLAAAGCGDGGAKKAEAERAARAEAVSAESARLTTLLDAQFEEELQRDPEWLTSLGRKEHYDLLKPRTEAEEDADLAWRRASVARMRQEIDYTLLDEEAKTSFDMWALELEREELAAKYRRNYYIFGRSGDHSSLPSFLINYHKVDDAGDMTAYTSRLRAIGPAIDDLLVRAKAAADGGVRMPLFAYDQALKEARAVITGAPFSGAGDSPLWADAKAKIEALRAAGKITDNQARELSTGVQAGLVQMLKPAYGRLIAWLEADRKRAPSGATGASTLPDGENFYRAALKLRTTVDLTPDQIHELGLKEVARIRGEMEKIKEQVGFRGTIQDFFVYVRTDPKFFYPDTDEGRAQYLALAERYIGDLKARLPEYFGILPKASLLVKRVEPFREEAGGAQFYESGSPDGSRPGVFYAHLSDMKAMSVPALEAIAYHEGLPGHHMQISIAQERAGLPKFRTQYGYTAYVEGWALYSEALAREMGGYKDPYSDFGRLSGELWRAVRLVVDTGIHARGWSEAQAVQYCRENSPQTEGAIRSEVRRYTVWPGQATAYKIGMLKIQELRAAARGELGDRFNIRDFHDVVLGGGSLPLPVLEARVKRWIAAQKFAGASE